MRETIFQMKRWLKREENKMNALTFCHAGGCNKRHVYLKRWGYVGNPGNGAVYCKEHSHLLGKGD